MSLVRLLVWASLLAGCLKPDLQPCGDLLCAADSVCLPSGQCATQESIDACTGHVDGQVCMTSVFTGSCVTGVCTAPRCGDGVISGSEQCDGPVDGGVDCVTYGFDTGVPTCSALCGLDVVGSCVRFGWERVFSEGVGDAWTDGTTFALVSAVRDRVRLYHGTQLIQEATAGEGEFLYSIAGNGPTIAVGLYSSVLRSDNGGPFVKIDTSALGGGTQTVEVGDDGTIYLADFGSRAILYRSTPTGWSKILDDPNPAGTLLWREGQLYVGYYNGNIERYTPGGAWTSFTSLPSIVRDIAARPGGGYYLTTDGSGAFLLQSSTLTKVLDANVLQVVVNGEHMFLGGDDNGMIRASSTTLAGQEQLDCPIYGMLISDGKDMYIYGNGLYRFTGTQFSRRPGTFEPARDAKLFGDGEPGLVTQSEVVTRSDYVNWTYSAPNELPVAIAGHSAIDFYVSERFQLEHWNGTAYALVASPNGTSDMLDILWDDATSTLYAVGTAGLAMKRVGTTWTMLTGIANCDVYRLAMQHGVVYAAGTCGSEGVVWKLTGTTWSELHRGAPAIQALSVDPSDNIYTAGPDGGAMQIAGVWKAEPRAQGVSISATSPADIWVGGGPDDLLHWDGTIWSRVRIVGAATPHVLATPDAVYIVGASTSVLVR